mmetsp:Transcript_24745/g.67308  ORF Transcript_24745/g.67308 Transcript_24745/m.67308 type:complete len:269 (+) Transcript_24745:78-884(+)
MISVEPLDVAVPVGETSSNAASAKGNRQIRCGSCCACTAQDCGQCGNCMDMPKFGGPGHKKQACSKRKCLQLAPCKTRKTDAPEPKRQKSGSQPVTPAAGLDLDLSPDPASTALTDLMLLATGDADIAYGSPRADVDDPLDILNVLTGEDAVLVDPIATVSSTAGGHAPDDFGLVTPPDLSPSKSRTHAGLALKDEDAGAVKHLDIGLGFGLGADETSHPSESSSPQVDDPCAVTQADVAATHAHVDDQKLDWAWLALSNLEDEFVNI